MCYRGSTSTMLTHLKKHPPAATSEEDGPNASRQTCMSKFLTAPRKCDRGHSEKTLSLIANMIAMDMLPVSCMEGKGFRPLMAYMEPEYTVPSQKSITSRLEKMHTHCAESICAALAQTDKVALTTDIWTSLAVESYVTVTCHYIDEEWEMKSTVLQTHSMPERDTAENLAEVLRTAAEE